MKRIISFIKSKKWWLIIAAVVLGGIIFLNTKSAGSNAKKIKSIVVKQETLKDTLSFSGEIDADEKADLRFQTSGYLAWVGVKTGDKVKKYQVLATLDQRQVKKQMSQYLNNYSKTRWDFEQTADDNKDYQTNGMTEEARREIKRTVEKSQFDLNNAVLNVELQDLAIQFSRLWTPIEGLVTKVDVPFAGVNITPAGAEIQVVNPKTIYFVATADQNEVTKIKEGMEGDIKLDAYPDQKLSGKIEMIAFTPRTGESSILYEVKIGLNDENLDYKYRLGMSGDIDFVLSERQVDMALPSSFIKTENGQKYVFKGVGDKTVKTNIEVGENVDGLVEIKSGLSQGETVYDQSK